MGDNTHIRRARALISEIAKQNAATREVMAKSLEVLRLPAPDTFLGRKTQEPFPKEADVLTHVMRGGSGAILEP